MTRQEEVYADTLNLFGSDFSPPLIQDLIDYEHGLADPEFARRKAEALRAALVTD